MKFIKYLTVSILILTLFIPAITGATSGACSWHGGVDCDKGWQANGKVYCNDDGWTGSMVYYDFMVKCENEKFAPECVDYIKGKDEYLKEINDLIFDTRKTMAYTDTSNPYVAQRWKNYLDYLYTLRDGQISRYNNLARICTDDIKKKQQQYLDSQKTQLSCPSGYVLRDNQCLTQDQSCNISYPNTKFLRINDISGRRICDCKNGYVWNKQRTGCIIAPVVPVKTNDQICSDTYGINSNWTGAKNDNGGLICDCKNGYEWNSDKTACVKKEVTSCSEGYILINNKCITHTKNCKNYYGGNVYGTSGDDGKGLCHCLDGYKWNSNETACVSISSEIKGVSDNILIPEGALIRATNGIDIYIVKYVGSKKFKRLILSPSVFNNYGHLRWEDVIDVDWTTLNSFATSDLVRAIGDDKIYRLYSQGDSGQKRMIKNNGVLTRLGFDPDSIYEINRFDRESYLIGSDLE